ncbi:MAG: hypothetical protein H0S80_05050 [Desulfovibrionaceae bacterium]|nr:hypothetical protein [Desulfovibrionaceae bacterium]
MQEYRINLGGDYLTFYGGSPVNSGESPTKEQSRTVTAKATPSAPQAPQHTRNHKDRRRKLLKWACSLPEGDYQFLTLATDKRRNPKAYKNPKQWQAWLNRFRSAFVYRFPKGFYIWKVEYDSDHLGVHFHLIVKTGAGTQLEDFHDWATKVWRRIVRSSWERLTDTKELTAARIGYFFKKQKANHDSALTMQLGRAFSFGLVGKKNAVFIEPKPYKPSQAQMERIRALLRAEIDRQAQHRHGVINQRQLNSINSDFCFQAFLGAELKANIQSILEETGCKHFSIRNRQPSIAATT